MNSNTDESNHDLYDEDGIEDEDDMENEDSSHYVETETPHYVSIVDTIPTIDYLMEQNHVSNNENNCTTDQNSNYNGNNGNYEDKTSNIDYVDNGGTADICHENNEFDENYQNYENYESNIDNQNYQNYEKNEINENYENKEINEYNINNKNTNDAMNNGKYIPLTQPKSIASSSPSASCKNFNYNTNINTDSTDDISITAVNDNQSSNSAFEGYSSPDGCENKELIEQQPIGIFDLQPDIIPIPPFFNEPATLEAIERLGFVPEDLMPSDYALVPGNDEIRFKLIIELEKRRIQMIEEVINERNKIIQGIQEKESPVKTKNSFKPKSNSKKKIKRKIKKNGKKKKRKNQEPQEDDSIEIKEKTKPKSKRRRKITKKKQEEVPEFPIETFSVSKPVIFRKKIVKKELAPDEIRKKKIEETIQNQQKKVEIEIAKKIEESEKRIKMQQEQKNKEANDMKQKRLQRKKEIELMKKENDLKKQKAAQKALMKMDEVELRQAQIRKMKLDEIKKKNELREQRLMKAKQNMQIKHDEQVKRINDSMMRAERQNKYMQGSRTRGMPSRSTAKIIVPQVPPKKHSSPK